MIIHLQGNARQRRTQRRKAQYNCFASEYIVRLATGKVAIRNKKGVEHANTYPKD